MMVIQYFENAPGSAQTCELYFGFWSQFANIFFETQSWTNHWCQMSQKQCGNNSSRHLFKGSQCPARNKPFGLQFFQPRIRINHNNTQLTIGIREKSVMNTAWKSALIYFYITTGSRFVLHGSKTLHQPYQTGPNCVLRIRSVVRSTSYEDLFLRTYF